MISIGMNFHKVQLYKPGEIKLIPWLIFQTTNSGDYS